MVEYIGKAAMLEQLAEEAAELAQAALKLARIERGENPTPVTKREAKAHLIEEFTDVETCARELCLRADPEIEAAKRQRFYDRISAQDKEPHPVDGDWSSDDGPVAEPEDDDDIIPLKTVSKIIDDVETKICDSYCKYADGVTKEGYAQMLEKHCANCPLNEL
jgi:NTP pyrophosphatase (non-canonical NTP hydrolase)